MQPLRASPDELAAPRLDRFAGLKRTIKLCALALAGLLATRLIWGYLATHQVESRLAQYRARGEPARSSESNPPPIPDEQNAAYYILRAGRMLTPLPQQNANLYWLAPKDPCTPDDERIARAWIASNRAALEVMQSGLACERAVWKTDYTDPRLLLELFSTTRNLENLLITESTFDLKDGDHRACLDHIEQAMRVNHTLRSLPLGVAQISCSSMNTAFADQIQQVLKTLKVQGEPQPNQNAPSHPAARAQIRRLIAIFLDDQADQRALLRAFLTERISAAEFADLAGQGQAWKYQYVDRTPTNWLDRVGLWWIAPRFKIHAAGEMDYLLKSSSSRSTATFSLRSSS